MSKAGELIKKFNDSYGAESDYEQLQNQAIQRWEVLDDNGTPPTEVFLYNDGSIAVVPEASSGTAINVLERYQQYLSNVGK